MMLKLLARVRWLAYVRGVIVASERISLGSYEKKNDNIMNKWTEAPKLARIDFRAYKDILEWVPYQYFLRPKT